MALVTAIHPPSCDWAGCHAPATHKVINADGVETGRYDLHHAKLAWERLQKEEESVHAFGDEGREPGSG